MKNIVDWYFEFLPIENMSNLRRLIMHAVFWVLFSFFLTFASISNIRWDFILYLSWLGTIQSMIFFYGFIYISFPLISSRKTILLGLLSFALVSIFYSLISYLLYEIALNYNLFTNKSYLFDYAVNYVKNGVFSLFSYSNIFFELNSIMSSLAIPLLIKFSRTIEKYSREIEKVSREKVELELSFLKSQINPHFLLNSMNNIYSQVVSKDKNAANTIITLSNLLKYILYHSHEEYLDLSKEINFIRDFIDLEKLRNGKHLSIRFSQEGDFDGYKIAPFILINYIENAFKHGINRNEGVTVIVIAFKMTKGVLTFMIENTIYRVSDTQTKEGGIGLINTQKRLMNLYNQKHNLVINRENDKFHINLTLNLE